MLLSFSDNVFSNFHLKAIVIQYISVHISNCGEVTSENRVTQTALAGNEKTNFALVFLLGIEDECNLFWAPSYMDIKKLSACEPFHLSIAHPSDHRGSLNYQ